MYTKSDVHYTQRVVQTGLFVALALVIRSFGYMVYLGGAPGMRISFSGIFAKFPAILFGPVFGGITGGLIDILGYIMKPEGGYIPWLTVTAVLGGVIIGLLWKAIEAASSKKVHRGFFIFFILLGILGVLTHFQVSYVPKSSWAQAIHKMGKSKDFATIGLEVIAVIGLILFGVDAFLQKKYNELEVHKDFLKLLIVTGIAGIIVTTLNTYILQLFIPALAKKGFIVFWIPRVIQELFMTVIQAYIISYLLSIYRKLFSQKK